MKFVHVVCHAAFLFMVMVLWGKNNILTGIALSAGVIAFFAEERRPVTIVVCLLAGFTGIVMEYWCTAVLRSWAYVYPSTIVLPFHSVVTTLPGWLFLFWGYFTVIIMNLAAGAEKWLYSSVFWRTRALKRSIAILAWVIIIELIFLNNAVAGQGRYAHYIVLCAAMIIFWHTPGDLIIFYSAAVCATIGEWMCVQRGLFTYNSLYIPEFGVPATLPLAWGFSVLLITRLGSYLIGEKAWVRKS